MAGQVDTNVDRETDTVESFIFVRIKVCQDFTVSCQDEI